MVSKKNKTSPPESRRARLYFFISNYSTTASSHLNTVMEIMMHNDVTYYSYFVFFVLQNKN